MTGDGERETLLNDHSEEDDEEDENENEIISRMDRNGDEDIIEAAAAVMEAFPEHYGLAGMLLQNGRGSLYQNYHDSTQDERNVFAPFKSKLEWELV